MSEDADSRTEAPSARRLEKARQEGQVPLGKEVVAVAALGAGAIACVSLGGRLIGQISDGVRASLQLAPSTPFAELWPLLLRPWGIAAGVAAFAALGASVATLAQTRGGMWPELAAPDLGRLWGAHRLKRLFSRELLVDLLLSIVKVVALLGAVYGQLRDAFLTLPALLHLSPGAQLQKAFVPVASATFTVLLMLLGFAGIDLALTHFRFRKKLMMTREEAQREMREDEGDPLYRSRRRKRHRELSRAHVAQEVPRADAVLVNPTHVAVAIRYRKEEGAAPRVIAKGKGSLAEVMRELARENGIPIVEDIPLARHLYRKVKVGGQIPADTYKAVAAVLAFVYRITRPLRGASA